jgi:hypothetical protein
MLVTFLLAGYALLVGEDVMDMLLVTVQSSHTSRQAVLEIQLASQQPFHLWKIAALGPIHVAA